MCARSDHFASVSTISYGIMELFPQHGGFFGGFFGFFLLLFFFQFNIIFLLITAMSPLYKYYLLFVISKLR